MGARSNWFVIVIAAAVCLPAAAADADRSEPGTSDTAPAASSVPPSRPIAPDALLGDLEAVRERVAAHGLRFEAGLTGDMFRAGGEAGAGRNVVGLLDLKAQFDTRAIGWRGGRAVLRVQGRAGHSPEDFAGDVQGTSNIAAQRSFDIYEAYYEQRLGAFAMRAGYQDFNVDFNATDRGGLFLNPSFGISPELGEFGPSIYPQTFPGLTLAWVKERGGYVQAAAYRHLAPSADLPLDGTGSCDGRGPFYALEAGAHLDGALAKFAGGAWYDDRCVATADGAVSGNAGAYALVEGTLPVRLGASGALEAFAKFGVTRSDRNAIARFAGVGLSLRGPFRGRHDDALGIALARAAGPGDGGAPHDNEATFEFTYRVAVLPGLALQPDVQLVRQPGMHSGSPMATVFILRTAVTF